MQPIVMGSANDKFVIVGYVEADSRLPGLGRSSFLKETTVKFIWQSSTIITLRSRTHKCRFPVRSDFDRISQRLIMAL